MGLSVISWGGVTASRLSEDSIYPLQTNTATKEFQRIENLRASTTQYGMTKLSNATDITDVNSAALSASEKNPNTPGTLSNSIQKLNNKTNRMINWVCQFGLNSHSVGISQTIQLYNASFIMIGDQHGAWINNYGIFYLSCNQYNPLVIPIVKGVDCPTFTLDTNHVLTATPVCISEITFNIFKVMY